MTIRILADREPYSSFADAPPVEEGIQIVNGPAGLDEPSPDILVMPAADFLLLRRPPPGLFGEGSLFMPYGPVALMERSFDQGCADYLREPWSLPELRARGSRLFTLRFRAGEASLELRGTRLWGFGRSIALSEGEAAFLRLLVINAPRPIPRGAAQAALPRRLRTAPGRAAASLRARLESLEPGLGGRLLAIRGFGYRLDGTACG
jgi:hypothetical protein